MKRERWLPAWHVGPVLMMGVLVTLVLSACGGGDGEETPAAEERPLDGQVADDQVADEQVADESAAEVEPAGDPAIEEEDGYIVAIVRVVEGAAGQMAAFAAELPAADPTPGAALSSLAGSLQDLAGEMRTLDPPPAFAADHELFAAAMAGLSGFLEDAAAVVAVSPEQLQSLIANLPEELGEVIGAISPAYAEPLEALGPPLAGVFGPLVQTLLWSGCRRSEAEACDTLSAVAEPDSALAQYGRDCGGRRDGRPGTCASLALASIEQRPSFEHPDLRSFNNDLTTGGQPHIAAGGTFAYDEIPPYAGPHAPLPVRCGLYDEAPPYEAIVHSMEHGTVVLYYAAGEVSAAALEGYRAIAASLLDEGRRIILSPSGDLRSRYLLVAWGQLLPLDEAPPSIVRQFVAAFENLAPERLARAAAC